MKTDHCNTVPDNSSMIGENKGALERVIGKAVHRFHDPSGFSRNQNSRKGT